jgi:membrane-bound serine protease (ClpP class)
MTANATTLLIMLLAAGSLLIGAEIFIPGAVAGTLGAFALVGAVVVAFGISTVCGFYVAVGVIVLSGITVVLWIKLFPRSSIGKSMTLSEDGKTFKAASPHLALLGKTGVAHSELRPAGFALIDGQRVDVVGESGMISQGQAIKVVRIDGNRIVVRKVE